MKNLAAGYELIARIIMMVFVLNVALIVHTLLGFGVTGFFPAIAACYASCRTWALSEDRRWTVKQTWMTFHRAWKKEWRPANVFGWPQFLVWALLIWDYYLVNWNNMGPAGAAASGVVLLVNVFYALFVLVSWAVASNYDERPWWIARVSLHMVIARPLCSVMLILVLCVTAWVWMTWPGVLIVFGLALPIFLVVMTVYSFGRLHGMDTKERLAPGQREENIQQQP